MNTARGGCTTGSAAKYGGYTDKPPEQTKPDHQICGAYRTHHQAVGPFCRETDRKSRCKGNGKVNREGRKDCGENLQGCHQNRRGNGEGNAKGSGCGCKGRTESGGDCPPDCHSCLQSGCCGGKSYCCGDQGDCSSDKSAGCSHCCRGLGCGRGRRGYLSCCLDRLFLLWYFLFKRGYRLRKDDAAGHSGNQHGLPERAGCH